MPRTVTIDGYDFEVAPLDEADLGDDEAVYVVLVEDGDRLLVVDVGQVPHGGDRFGSIHRQACWEDQAAGRPILVGRMHQGSHADIFHVEEQVRRFHDPPCAPE